MLYTIKSMNGAVIETTEEPRFVKKNANGCFIQTTQGEATHIAADGKTYELKTEAIVEREDVSKWYAELDAKIDYIAMKLGIDFESIKPEPVEETPASIESMKANLDTSTVIEKMKAQGASEETIAKIQKILEAKK